VRVRAPLLALAATALLAAGAVVPSGIALGATNSRPVDVSVDTLLPRAPLPGSMLVIGGAVANTSGSVVPGVTVRLRVGEQPLADRSALAQVADGTITSTGTIIDGSRSAAIPTLAPGQSIPFTITVPVDSLRLPSPGVYQILVEAQSDPGDGNRLRVGLIRTFLPWFPDPATTPITGLVTLWPLTETTAVDADGVLLSEQIPRAVAPGGRLRFLLDAAAAHSYKVTWVIDPALVQTLDSMADGYRVRRGTTVVAGVRPDDATNWLDDLRRVTQRADVMALPYAVPDDVALVRGGLPGDVVRSITTAASDTSAVIGRTVSSTLAWPPTGWVDSATLSTLTNAAPRGIVLSERQVSANVDFTPSGAVAIPGTAGSATAVIPDDVLSDLLVAPHRTAGESLLDRQRLLAELAVIGEQITDSRTVVMAPPPRWTSTSAYLTELLADIGSVPWIRPVGLATLLGGQPSSVQRTIAPYTRQQRSEELSASYISRIREAQRSTTLVGDVIAGSAATTVPLLGALARASSAAFRVDTIAGSQIIAGVRARTSKALTGVRIISRGSVTLPGDTGIIPISISNGLDTAVTVGLVLTAVPSVRLSTAPIAPFTIPAGATTLIEVSARVSGSDPVPLEVRLTSPTGDPFGTPAQLSVGSSAYSRAAAWVVGAAFAALVVLLAINAVRRIRSSRANARQVMRGDADSGITS